MKLKLRDLEIPINNPFANDKLERKGIAETLAEIIKNISIPFVIGVDSSWEQGRLHL